MWRFVVYEAGRSIFFKIFWIWIVIWITTNNYA